jgi:hypothetical protein
MGLLFAWCANCDESITGTCPTHLNLGPHGQKVKGPLPEEF